MYANEQQNQQAISDFDKVLLLNPDNIRALSNRAKLKQNTADYKGAIADYNRIIELYPYFLEAYYHRSQVKTLTGDLEGAKKDMETGKLMSELNYSKSAGQLKMDSIMLNKLSYLSGEFNSSSDLIADTINLGFRPIFYLTAKDSSNAGKYYSSLLENYNPGRLKPLYLSNKTTDYYDTAIWKSNSGIENTEMQLYTAIHFTNMQLCNEAATLYDKIISEESQNALALFARGVNTCREIELLSNANEPYFLSSGSQTVYENERHEKCLSAKEDFAKALLLAPDFSFAYFNLAYIKCLLGDYYGALYDYEQAIKLNPAFADAFYNYGFLLFYLDHKKESCRNMSRAGELGLSEAFMFMKKYCVGVIDK
jgi:tetratricopeptide (TPR) repeat protein